MKDLNVYKVIQDEMYILLEYTMRIYELQDSQLLKNTHIEYRDNLFLLIYPDYGDYVNSGRRPGAKLPPYDAIENWCRSKGISPDNETVWRIRQGIKRDGIAARPFIDRFLELAENRWNGKWAEKVFEEIISDIVNWFDK